MKIDETWGYNPQEVVLEGYVLDFASTEIVGKLGEHKNRGIFQIAKFSSLRDRNNSKIRR